MNAITKEHVEWAVIHRLRLIAERGHAGYKVMQAYAGITSTLCWTMQCVRNEGKLRLLADDMRRITVVLAVQFCTALQQKANPRGDRGFVRESLDFVDEQAA